MGLYQKIKDSFNDRRIMSYEKTINRINSKYYEYKTYEHPEMKLEYIIRGFNNSSDLLDDNNKLYLFLLAAKDIQKYKDIFNELRPLIDEKISKGKTPFDAIKEVLKDKDIEVDYKEILPSFRNKKIDKDSKAFKFIEKLEDSVIRNNFYNKTQELKKRVSEEISKGKSVNKVLKEILPDAYGLVKAACEHELGYLPYDVQLMGAIAMSEGNIAQMYTGEGKTLTAVFPAYLNALVGKEVDIFTANDYLAERDAKTNKNVFNLLGLSVGCVKVDGQSLQEKKDAYNCDIVYGSSTAFAFDYLNDTCRDNPKDLVQRKEKPGFVIVDEADQILINNALTPYVLSEGAKSLSMKEIKENVQVMHYLYDAHALVEELKKNAFITSNQHDFEMLTGQNNKLTDKANNNYSLVVGADEVVLTEKGETELFYNVMKEKIQTLAHKHSKTICSSDKFICNKDYIIKEDGSIELTYEGALIACSVIDEFGDLNLEWLTDEKYQVIRKYLSNALKAEFLLERGRDYQVYVDPDSVLAEIVVLQDGRIVPNSKFRDGIHQALELKEGLTVRVDEGEKLLDDSLSSISNRALLARYDRISGMTGTADVDAFNDIYKLDTFDVPKNKEYEYKKGRIREKPRKRIDKPVIVYKNNSEKIAAIVSDILESYQKGQPVLVVADNDEQAKIISKCLDDIDIPLKHNLLIAGKNLEEEARIISEAGKIGAITIASEMAGRGTDIKLGGEGASKKDRLTVYSTGGLKYIQTNPFKTTRNDKQGKGRVGRQGEPGETVMYASISDLASIGVSKSQIREINLQLGERDHIDDAEADGYLIEVIEEAQENNEFRADLTIASTDTVDYATSSVGLMLMRNRKQVLAEDDMSVIFGNMIDSVIDETLKDNVPEKKRKKISSSNTRLSRIKLDYENVSKELKNIFGIDIDEKTILKECTDVEDIKNFISDKIMLKQKDLYDEDENDKYNSDVKKSIIEQLNETYSNFMYSAEQTSLQKFNSLLGHNENYNQAVEIPKIYDECRREGWRNAIRNIFRPNLKYTNSSYRTTFDDPRKKYDIIFDIEDIPDPFIPTKK